MQDVETVAERVGKPDKRARRSRGTRYPWRASIYLTQEDGERLETAAERLNTSIPEAVRQAVKSGLPLVMDKARKHKARARQ